MLKRLLAVLLVPSCLLVATPAYASQYEVFGNAWNSDCAFASLANAVRYNWPDAPITTDQVLSAWNAAPQDPFGFMVTTGFGGHQLDGWTAHPHATKALITHALSHGGMVAWLNLSFGFHAEAIVGVSRRGPVGIWSNFKKVIPWRTWNHDLQDAYTLSWLPAGDVALSLVNNDVTPIVPYASVLTSPGDTVSIPLGTPPVASAGLAFCGWSRTPSTPYVVDAPGSSFTVSVSTALYPVFFPATQSCGAWANGS